MADHYSAKFDGLMGMQNWYVNEIRLWGIYGGK